MLDTSALLTPPLGDAVTAREHDADVAARLGGFNQIHGLAATRQDVVGDRWPVDVAAVLLANAIGHDDASVGVRPCSPSRSSGVSTKFPVRTM